MYIVRLPPRKSTLSHICNDVRIGGDEDPSRHISEEVTHHRVDFLCNGVPTSCVREKGLRCLSYRDFVECALGEKAQTGMEVGHHSFQLDSIVDVLGKAIK